MSLQDRLSEDLKQAMKAKDQLRMDVIRMIKAAVVNKGFELKKSLDDVELSRVMTTLVKQRSLALHWKLDEEVVPLIGQRARGTPRHGSRGRAGR